MKKSQLVRIIREHVKLVKEQNENITKAHRHLVQYALDRGLVVSVHDGESITLLRSNDFENIVQEIEDFEECLIILGKDGKAVGKAHITPWGYPDETVADYSVNPLMDEWFNTYLAYVDSLNEAVSPRIQAVVNKKNEKLKSDFKKSVTSEVNDSMNRDRMEGLINEQDFIQLSRSIYSIGDDLIQEGFSVNDIEDYMIDVVRHTLASLHGLSERKLTKKEFTKKHGKEEGEKTYHATTPKMAKKKY